MPERKNTISPAKRQSKTINLMTAFEKEPPKLDFIWQGFLSGTVGALVAPGATGKSYWALEAAMAIACSVAGGDLVKLSPLKTGRVVYLAGEDPEAALMQRIHSIGEHLSPTARASISENLIVEPIMGNCPDIMEDRHLDRVLDLSVNTRLIVLDTLSRFHRLDENNNGDMANIVAKLEHIAVSTGASVLYLHHVNKGSARDGLTDQQQAARGASALIDNVRWCGYIAKMTEQESQRLSDRCYERAPIGDRRKQFMRFGVSKQNYGENFLEQWYRRHDGGVLRPVELTEVRHTETRKRSELNFENGRISDGV